MNAVIPELVSIHVFLCPMNTVVAELVSIHLILLPMSTVKAEIVSIYDALFLRVNTAISRVSQFLYLAKKRNPSIGKIYG